MAPPRQASWASLREFSRRGRALKRSLKKEEKCSLSMATLKPLWHAMADPLTVLAPPCELGMAPLGSAS